MLDENTPAEPSPIEMFTGSWLDEQTFPELKWVVPGIIPEGLSILAGAPKLGKSWLTLGIALAVAAGGKALGHIGVGKPRPVLLLALEDGHRRLQERSRKLMVKDRLPSKLDYVIKAEQHQIPTFLREWLDTHGHEAPLVVIDTLGKVMPNEKTGESAYARDYRVIGNYKNIIDEHPGAGLVFVHHTKKGATGDFLESVSGTQGIAGAADSTMILTRPRQSTGGLLAVTGRDVTENEYAMTSTDGAWSLDGRTLDEAASAAQTRRSEEATDRFGDRAHQVIDVVNQNPEGVTPADICKVLGITEPNKKANVRQQLARLLASEAISRSGDKYTPHLGNTSDTGNTTHVRPGLHVIQDISPHSPSNTPVSKETESPEACIAVSPVLPPTGTWRVSGERIGA